jgi:hypothetical protein
LVSVSNFRRIFLNEESAQSALTTLPVEAGCSFGSLKYHGEKGVLRDNLRLQEAVFPHYFSPFRLDRLPFHCVLILEHHLSIPAEYI